SKLVLNLRNPDARRDLAGVYELHRTLMTNYPHPRVEQRCDLLFRIEPSRTGPPIVLVQTRDQPDWCNLPGGYLLRTAESKSLDLAFKSGQLLRFRLRANPTKKLGTATKQERLAGKKDNGQRFALLREEEQIAWLVQKGEPGGFRVPGEWVQDMAGK